MKLGQSIVEFSIRRPKLITSTMVIMTIVLSLFIVKIKVDTDPENMLPKDEAVRVFHNFMKKELSLNDMIVVGVVDKAHKHGVFSPEALSNIYDLATFAKTIRWQDPDNPSNTEGVVEVDLLSPSTVDNIEQGGIGVVKFEWLMQNPPGTIEDALAIRDKALKIPFLNGTLVSEDGKAVALYIPITSKDISYKVSQKLKEKIAEFTTGEQYYITGLPVAQDTFGVEMFYQMATSAPLAMLVIFLLMLYFFRKLVLIISPMIIAMVSVLCTMGLLIGMGYTVHIMSSMIPIFIMPIAVLDSIHILSEFFDRYQQTRDRKSTILKVMQELFTPMLYTSLTSAAGFASLALTPIPPVQVFGIFVSIGIMLAWVLTVTFIPAYIMFIPQKKLEDFGAGAHKDMAPSAMTRTLHWLGAFTVRRAKVILALSVVLAIIAAYGISLIQINDNPIKWFTKSHPIRVADKVLNDHFGGTYMAYLAVEPDRQKFDLKAWYRGITNALIEESHTLQTEYPAAPMIATQLISRSASIISFAMDEEQALSNLTVFAKAGSAAAAGDKSYAWDEYRYWLEAKEQAAREVFKQPAVLNYLEELQAHLTNHSNVGKANSLVDIIKTVHRELWGSADKFVIPDKATQVAETLFQYQNSHRPHDLWHFVTPDYRKSSIWLQLKSGDNKDMLSVARAASEFIANNPPPIPLKTQWFGLTYINVVWQEKMVSGMLQAFLGSFLVVLFMMIVLFRSALWGLLSMIPLTITIGLIYGAVGYIGKDYDMPIAVLSSLTLGLAIDFAIHFLARSRKIVAEQGSWRGSAEEVFGEPARAITRNVIVIAVGFLPLLAAPLVPYKTVGVFLATILAVSGIGTLFILPALITVLDKWLFPRTTDRAFACKCGTCTIAGFTLVALVAVNVHQFLNMGWTILSWVSLIGIVVTALICLVSSRRTSCIPIPTEPGETKTESDT